MAQDPVQRMLLVLWLLLCSVPWAFSQQIAPSNATLVNDSYQYSLMSTAVPNISSFKVQPLTNGTRLGAQETISGALFLATPQTASNTGQNDIAYISCDPSAYTSGNIDATRTVNLAASQKPGAIVLFSNSSSYCTITATNMFSFDVIYTMVQANLSSQLANALQNASQSQSASIQQTSNTDNETTTSSSGNPAFGGHSPTTAVAMIILYSITGIITALFLIIIVVGAIRAHRHPERYGPQNMLGRPRQSRAKGIARAMLDTLPIVKFGEREEEKPAAQGPQARDIEMGNIPGETRRDPLGGPEIPRISSEQPQHEAVAPNHNAHNHAEHNHISHEGPEPVTTETATGTDKLPSDEADTDANADNGLACSVCTDDFVKGQDIRVLPCNHKFHPECIDPWLLNVSGTCPLCRVDLRPTTSHPDPDPSNSSDPDFNPSTDDLPTSADDSLTTDQHPDSTTRARQRCSRTGLSLYIAHTLNRGRMRDATPEERIAALRRLRTVDRAGDGDGGGGVRDRWSARLSRAWGDERRGSRVFGEERMGSSHRGSYAG